MYIEPTPPLYLGTYIGPCVPLHLFRELYTASKNLAVLNVQLDLAFNNVKPKDWYFVLD